ncbi:hypothetical protein BKA67DRAFT_558100 [Truncatella angustata]|uniref:Zn(2)-C6 fungal-type domain-containing protein n=1 Tax=Truncatella angustata TaxID=152316 RepID=A0A9P8UU81_9PEZI|nr:uncharacterized protein BKA67DRAFT_558100 [Truncatella angustata]KAH6658454.1 hypothetical protein BKA67DRAFT_558100 [Truncatella angustata]
MARAREACISCKTRKKKCNKAFPSCSYCIQKDLDCKYISAPRRRNHVVSTNGGSSNASSIRREMPSTELVSIPTPSDTTLFESVTTTTKTSLYRPVWERSNQLHIEIQDIIRSTGQFVDDITARYFQTFHRHLPIILRTRFQKSLIASPLGPSTDSSVLLLSICLIASLPNPGHSSADEETPAISRKSLYLVTKAIIAQVQGCLPPSVHLIQANILLAVYEYADGRPEAAFLTITGCARMAYAARLHDRTRHHVDTGIQIEAQEADNTWWGIVIYERALFCEVSVFEQPLVTTLPPKDAKLPIEWDILDRADLISPNSMPDIPASCLDWPKIGCFGRTAQATCLVDQVIKGLSIPDLDSRLRLLQDLDGAIQAFLALILPQCQGKPGVYCAAIALAVRGLFTLHGHVLDIPQQAISSGFRSLEEWKKSSLAALDTSTIMAIDIAECHHVRVPPDLIHITPPSHSYMVRAAIQHMHTRPFDGTIPWSEASKDQLRLYLDKFCRHWDVTD